MRYDAVARMLERFPLFHVADPGQGPLGEHIERFVALPSPPLFDRMPTYRTQGKHSLNFLCLSGWLRREPSIGERLCRDGRSKNR